MPQLFADIAVPLRVDSLFTYRIPEEFRESAAVGVRALVPFGRRTVTGIIVNLTDKKPALTGLREIEDILDPEPVLSNELMDLSAWMSGYYFAPRGEVLKMMLPQGSLHVTRKTITLMRDFSPAQMKLSTTENALIEILRKKESRSLREMQKLTGVKGIHAVLGKLASKKLIEIREERTRDRTKPKLEQVVTLGRPAEEAASDGESPGVGKSNSKLTPRQQRVVDYLLKSSDQISSVPAVTDVLKATGASLSTVKTLVRKGVLKLASREVRIPSSARLEIPPSSSQTIVLNSRQKAAIEAISATIREKTFRAFLLHGVTGSGKTEVYIGAIQSALSLGRSAIVLVPEIALTPQMVGRFTRHFGGQVAVMHSRMSAGERTATWRAAREGTCSIVIGPRSAVFAPLKSPGLIVVDEEQESSYKQFDQTPRYHARDVALVRAQSCGAAVVLGSATPSMETYANALAGKYTMLELPERVDKAQLPSVTIVDMAEERKAHRKEFWKEHPEGESAKYRLTEPGSISNLLKLHIVERLKKREGIIILQNRRGFSPFVECPACGYVETCDNCQISMTYHLTMKHLRCHYCGKVKTPPDVCPQCGSTEIRYRGVGTQRVEEELRQNFPDARIERMDLDTTTRRGSHQTILRKFSDGSADILLGTQMVAKGLDFSRVTLVGVISADTQMLLPDFRSSERTFQLLTQVAGRAGRSVLTGEVIIQTLRPQNEVLRHVLTHDFRGFYEEESQLRKELSYPPYARLILLEFRGKSEQEVMRHAGSFADDLRRRKFPGIVLGPASAALAKLGGKYRWHIVLKSEKTSDPSAHRAHASLTAAVEAYRTSRFGKSRAVQFTVDVDPVGML
ncbi:MAG TPA: primosomal protein N' [Bacteroidota bacterium]|nr:primosomal protein N' [Bacteroidota bacterium]